MTDQFMHFNNFICNIFKDTAYILTEFSDLIIAQNRYLQCIEVLTISLFVTMFLRFLWSLYCISIAYGSVAMCVDERVCMLAHVFLTYMILRLSFMLIAKYRTVFYT